MKGVVAPLVLVALVCGVSAQVAMPAQQSEHVSAPQDSVDLDLGEEFSDLLGFTSDDRRAILRNSPLDLKQPLPEPASLAALTVGFGGLIRARLKKSGHQGSRRRR